jgi:DHA3 family tetracycline resistance protein-like MFS transporter
MTKQDPLQLYVRLRFLSAMFFSTIITINLVYQATVVGLNPLQLVLVGTLLEAVCFVFEIPTGIVADLYSRKLSVIIGIFLMGIGFIFEGIFPTFFAVLVAQVVWGIGATFVSGAREAWIADEVGEARAGKAFLKGQKANQAGAFCGILLSMVLANIDIRLPIVIGGIFYCMQAFYLMLVMPESNFQPTPPKRRETFGAMRMTFVRGLRVVRTNRAFLAFVMIIAVFGIFSEGFDRLWTPFLIDDFVFPSLWNLKPVVWFGIISMAATIMAAFFIGMMDKKTDSSNQDSIIRSLILINVLLPAAVLVFAVSGNFMFAASAYCFAFMLKEGVGPLSDSWINHNLEPKVRATVFSFCSQMNSFGQIVGGPVLGLIATLVSLRAGLAVAGAVLVPTLLLYGYLLKSGGLERVKVENR